MLLFNKPTAISYISKSGDKIYPVVIDIKEGVKSSETLSFMTADSNTGILSVAFMEGETIYNIDDATVVCDIERPDGTDLSIGAVKVADGVVEVPLGVNGTSQPGMYMFDFKIVRPGSKTIGVPLVSYTVTQSINTDEIVTQDDRLPVLNDLIVKIQNATSASTQATNECKTATNNVNNTLKSVNNAIASGTVDLELKQLRTSLNGTLHPTANDRINQMETHLLEATATTVETESSFTTVDATNNGYFEDVKLEGKTLVNVLRLGGDWFEQETTLKTDSTIAVGLSTYPKSVDLSLLKSNTVYTVIPFIDYTVIKKGMLYLQLNAEINGVQNAIFKIQEDMFNKPTLIATKELTNKNSRSLFIGGINCEYKFKSVKILVLEGDHTNNPSSYFEGLMSVGQDVEEVSVESVDGDGNLFDSNFWELGFISDSSGVYSDIDSYVRTKKIRVSPNTLYTFNGYSNRVYYYDANGNFISRIDIGGGTFLEQTNSFTTPSNCVYIALRYALSVSGSVITSLSMMKQYNTVICKGTLNGDLVYQSNKKPLLYFNPTTETWEKPVLREWDTIEKHSDGKYYYHKRSKEVVLNGSEDWSEYNTLNHANTFGAKLLFNDVEAVIRANYIVDTITKQPSTQVSMLDEEGLYLRGDSKLCYIKVLRSKLSTQDVAGFKAWLKANPTTVVYKLVQEEIYECTNIDLMTYSGETNYIINSGAISPKSLLKVHNNISNVVKILQEKVSLLENTFIAGLKSVLSGDMYSLATILYPEDFEQNDNTEQDIMVIPE